MVSGPLRAEAGAARSAVMLSVISLWPVFNATEGGPLAGLVTQAIYALGGLTSLRSPR